MINVWISSFPNHNHSDLGHKFPYMAQSPLTGQMIQFKNIDDVHEHFIDVYDYSIKKSVKKLGESIYLQGSFFYDLMLFVDQKIQDRIKEFTFCKSFNCPPFPSLNETPENIVDEFMTIESEFNSISEHKQRKSNGNK